MEKVKKSNQLTTNEITAQNHLPMSFLMYPFHKRRFYIVGMAVVVYMVTGSYIFSFFSFAGLTLVLSRKTPIRIQEKDELIFFVVARKVDKYIDKISMWVKKAYERYMNW